jgi:hypothetical protein
VGRSKKNDLGRARGVNRQAEIAAAQEAGRGRELVSVMSQIAELERRRDGLIRLIDGDGE